MTKNQKDIINQCENVFEQTAKFFCKKYFNTDDYYWIGREIGGTIEVCDMFFSFWDMLEYLRYGYTYTQMTGHYTHVLDSSYKGLTCANIKNFRYLIKSGFKNKDLV